MHEAGSVNDGPEQVATEAPGPPEDPMGLAETSDVAGDEADDSDPDYNVDEAGGDDDDDEHDEDEDYNALEEGEHEHQHGEERQGNEQPAEDYLDDGTDADGSTSSGEQEQDQVRRPISIQEFLAWRFMGRVPRNEELTRNRYAPYEDAVPQALTRGSLWQQLSAATGPGATAVRNRVPPLDSPLDAAFDSSMFTSRDARYGWKVRQVVHGAVAAGDPRVTRSVTLLGPAQHNDSSKSTSNRPYEAAAATAPTEAPEASGSRAGGSFATAAAAGPEAVAAAPARPVPSWPGRSAGRPPPSPPPAAAAAAASPLPPCGYLSGLPRVSAPRLLMRRERGAAAAGGPGAGLSGGQMRHLNCYQALPRYPRAVVDRLDSRAYIGQFSADGQFFVAAFQDRRVRLYDVERGWRLRKDITTRMCRWTITDTSVSPDQRFVLYSSIIPVVHLVEVGSVYDSVSSICNITQIHEPLNFDSNNLGFGIWSVRWSGDGREIVVGNNDASVVVMDVETKRVVAAASGGHEDDVNAVTYADVSPNIIVSGSDDTYIKVWDRRLLPGPACSGEGSGLTAPPERPQPAGVLVGHTEGITHLHARGDGTHLLSNSKDQTAKLWDLRMMRAGGSLRDAPTAASLPTSHVPHFDWDYRWQEYPGTGRVVRHPHDSSLQTFRGHTVQNTLIRAYFSPGHSTGQRFVYTGSAEGGVHVYDVVSGQEVEGSPLRLHRKLVRDVSWHPYDPVLATVSWDGTVVRWDAVPPTPGSRSLQVPGHDARIDDYI